MEKLKPCPFCGGNLEFVRREYTNKYGNRVVLQYWLHDVYFGGLAMQI